MKKILVFLFLSLCATNTYASIRVLPYIGVDYSSTFGSNAQPSAGVDFTYLFDSNLEVGVGFNLSEFRVMEEGEMFAPTFKANNNMDLSEQAFYLTVKYNIIFNENNSLVPYVKAGNSNSSSYYAYRTQIVGDKEDITNDESLIYGDNYFAAGLHYVINDVVLTLEYKVVAVESEYAKTSLMQGNLAYDRSTRHSNSIGFTLGYMFDAEKISKKQKADQLKKQQTATVVKS